MENKILENLEVIDLADKGHGVARHEGQVIFVKNGVPGDKVSVKISHKRKGVRYGEIIGFSVPSGARTEPFCQHYGICGGCQYQHIHYSAQLQFKQNEVLQAFRRIGGFLSPPVLPVIASEKQQYYRNKLEFTFSARKWLEKYHLEDRSLENKDLRGLGFHISKMFDKVLDLEECYFQPDPSNEIRNSVRHFCIGKGWDFYNYRTHQGFLRNMVIRNSSTGQWMVIIVFAIHDPDNIAELMDFIADRYPIVTSLVYVVNEKRNDSYSDLEFQIYKGNSFMMEEMDGLVFRVGPLSFFQVNRDQALQLYQKVVEFAGFKGTETVYDLYTGAGSIALFISRYVKKVIGIENVVTAIQDARINKELNNIHNVEFITGDIAATLNPDFVARHGTPDLVITDPPRSGMHNNVISMLLYMVPEKIVYVSCNPSTQARDIAMLSEKYLLTALQPVDMFPNTYHVECVALLERKPDLN